MEDKREISYYDEVVIKATKEWPGVREGKEKVVHRIVAEKLVKLGRAKIVGAHTRPEVKEPEMYIEGKTLGE